MLAIAAAIALVIGGLSPADAAPPDGRAYEMVRPPDKNGNDVSIGNAAIAPDGNTATFLSFGAFAGAQAGALGGQYLTRRGDPGWTTQGISPPQAPSAV